MICHTCNQNLPEEDFHKRKQASKRGKQSWCKNCRKEYDKVYHKKRWKSGKKKEQQEVRQNINREFIFRFLLRNPCVDCGENDPVVLEFDHLKDKIKNVSEMARHFSIDKLREEIEKCEVRCANCHRRKTAYDFNWWITRL
jgi:hypothetical protein